MTHQSEQRLDEVLERCNSFEECLLHDVRLVQYGFSAEVAFNVIWDDRGRIRDGILENPRLVTLELEGVAALRLVGGLSPAMDPAAIDWGLSEVALVERYEIPDGIGIRVLWEGERCLEIECREVTVRTGA
jgi:hypothetical protein